MRSEQRAQNEHCHYCTTTFIYSRFFHFNVVFSRNFFMLSCVSFSGVHCIFYKGLSTTNIILYSGLFMFENDAKSTLISAITPSSRFTRNQNPFTCVLMQFPISWIFTLVGVRNYALRGKWKMEYIIKQLIVSSKQ